MLHCTHENDAEEIAAGLVEIRLVVTPKEQPPRKLSGTRTAKKHKL